MIVNLDKKAMVALITNSHPEKDLTKKDPLGSYGFYTGWVGDLWIWRISKLNILTEKELWEIYLLLNPPKTPAGNWVFERSSGFNGFRCTVCGNWIYDNEEKKCQCD